MQALYDGMDVAMKKQLADIALNAAKAKGATYADVRIGRYLNQFVATRENKVQGIANTESFGAGVRVLANGCWGFAASDSVTKENIARTAERAVAVAKANAKIQGESVQLAPQKGFGEVSWKAPIERSAFEVPVKEKVDLLLSANAIAMQNGANFVNSNIFAVNEQKYFASTDGSYIDQDIHRIFPTFNVTRIDQSNGKFDTRKALSSPVGMGYEYLTPLASEKVGGVVTRYKNRYDILEDIKAASIEVAQKIKAKTVEPGKYKLVNIVADKTQTGSLGAVGWDDEGVKCKEWNLIKDGVLVNYQAIRDQAHIIGEKESHGCCYAQTWADVQFQRMANVSLQPGKEKRSVDDLIKNVEKGIYIIGDGSFSIDQQRYNFQFGGQTFYEIKNGKINGMLRDVAYQANTQEFWNSLTDIADKDDYRLGGAFNDGKGQPPQSNAVSHGSATARFNGVNVINTARKI